MLSLTESERKFIQNCVEHINVDRNKTEIYKMNICMLYNRTPLYSNIIQHRMKKFVMEYNRDNLIYFDQYELYRNLDSICNASLLGGTVHYPHYHLIQLRQLLSTIQKCV